MKSRPMGSGQADLASQHNDRRDDSRASSFLFAHQMLGSLALSTVPTNGQVVPIVINGTTITITAVTSIGSTANNVLIGGSAAAFVTNLVNFLRRPDLTTSTQVAASGANQTLLQYVGWAWPGSSTNIVPFSLNKNVNGIANALTSFNITGITVTSGTWTAQTMQLYVQDGTYYIGNNRYFFLGGSTPTVTAPVSHPRIDVLTIDNTGTLAWTTGTENTSPSAPTYPLGKVPICELYNVVSETALYDAENQQTGQGYIYNDVRNVMTQPFGLGTLDGAWFTDLAGIPSGAGVIPVANLPANSFNASSYVAATAITKGQAMILGTGVSGYVTANNAVGTSTQSLGTNDVSSSHDPATDRPAGNTIVTSATTSAIRAVSAKLSTNNFGGGGSYFCQAEIWAVNGSHQPTGSVLGSINVPLSANTTAVVNFVFSSPVAVSPSTEYAVIFRSQTTVNGGSVSLFFNTSQYLTYFFLTSTGPSTWNTASSSNGAWYEVWEVLTTSGKVQPSDTTQTVLSGDVYDLADNFCGFALATVSSGASVSVNLGPIDSDQTGLTVGREYFLNGSGGAIATTAGAVSVKVGLSMSTTSILIKFDNYP